jgi:hypothetical protein
MRFVPLCFFLFIQKSYVHTYRLRSSRNNCNPAQGAWIDRPTRKNSGESIAGYDCSRFALASFLPEDIGYTHVMPFCERLDQQPTVQKIPYANQQVVWNTSSCTSPNQPYLKFGKLHFSQLLATSTRHPAGRTLFLLGDSTQEEEWISLVCLLGKDVVDDSATRKEIEDIKAFALERWGLTSNKLMRKLGFLHLINGGRIVWLRSNFLISEQSGVVEDKLVEITKYSTELNMNYLDFEIPWTYFLQKRRESDRPSNGDNILVFNTGAHTKNMQQAKSTAKLVLRWLAQNFSGNSIFFRTNVPGSVECELLHVTNATSVLNWNWNDFSSFDTIWREEAVAQEINIKILDVRKMSMSRADAHPGIVFGQLDCLHFCAPGPVDDWNRLLFHELVQEQIYHELHVPSAVDSVEF